MMSTSFIIRTCKGTVLFLIGLLCYGAFVAAASGQPAGNAAPAATVSAATTASTTPAPTVSAAATASAAPAPTASAAATGNAAPATCDWDKSGTVVKEKDDFVEKFCQGQTLCLRADNGDPIEERWFKELTPGTTFSVMVVGIATCPDSKIKVTMTEQAGDSLFRTATEILKPSLLGVALAPEKPGTANLKVIDVYTIAVSEDDAIQSIRVEITGGKKPRSLSIPIKRGRYYLDIGVLVPFVPEGRRRVISDPIPGSSDRQLHVQIDYSVTAALVLNVFPGGKRRSAIAAFEGGVGGWRGLRDLIGIQFGIDVDFSDPIDQFYMGIVLEPIRGFSLNGGLALVKGQFLKHGFSDGMLLTTGKDPEFDYLYMPRPYFGLTLSTEIVETLIAAKNKISGLKPAQEVTH